MFQFTMLKLTFVKSMLAFEVFSNIFQRQSTCSSNPRSRWDVLEHCLCKRRVQLLEWRHDSESQLKVKLDGFLLGRCVRIKLRLKF